jgi:hypothetical protein
MWFAISTSTSRSVVNDYPGFGSTTVFTSCYTSELLLQVRTMTVKQIEECRSATVAHKPRERTRTHSAPYSYAVRTCGPTCSCDIFGLESHSKSRLTACTGIKSTNESKNQNTVAITIVDTSLVEEQSTSTYTESLAKIIEDVPTTVAEEVKDTDQALVQSKWIFQQSWTRQPEGIDTDR